MVARPHWNGDLAVFCSHCREVINEKCPPEIRRDRRKEQTMLAFIIFFAIFLWATMVLAHASRRVTAKNGFFMNTGQQTACYHKNDRLVSKSLMCGTLSSHRTSELVGSQDWIATSDSYVSKLSELRKNRFRVIPARNFPQMTKK